MYHRPYKHQFSGQPFVVSLPSLPRVLQQSTRAKFTSCILSADLITHRPRRSFNHPRCSRPASNVSNASCVGSPTSDFLVSQDGEPLISVRSSRKPRASLPRSIIYTRPHERIRCRIANVIEGKVLRGCCSNQRQVLRMLRRRREDILERFRADSAMPMSASLNGMFSLLSTMLEHRWVPEIASVRQKTVQRRRRRRRLCCSQWRCFAGLDKLV